MDFKIPKSDEVGSVTEKHLVGNIEARIEAGLTGKDTTSWPVHKTLVTVTNYEEEFEVKEKFEVTSQSLANLLNIWKAKGYELKFRYNGEDVTLYVKGNLDEQTRIKKIANYLNHSLVQGDKEVFTYVNEDVSKGKLFIAMVDAYQKAGYTTKLVRAEDSKVCLEIKRN